MMTNMVSLARQKSDILEPSLIKLSELLRYMLYDSNNNKITVTDEIEQLENFIDLQQLRFGENVDVKTEIKNESPGCMIEPMLLIPFIENAFKHGIDLDKRSWIKIDLNCTATEIHFTVCNSIHRGTDEDPEKEKGGIGNNNVLERLKLIYPGKHSIAITDNGTEFMVRLIILI